MFRISGQWCGKSPLAQVNQFHDLVTSRRLSGVSTSEPGEKSAIFFFNCTMQQPRIVVQYSVIVERNMIFSKPSSHPLWLLFFFPRFYLPSSNNGALWEWSRFDSVWMVRCLRIRSLWFSLISQLVLPLHTVKIRGGRGHMGRMIEMSSCPTTQHN